MTKFLLFTTTLAALGLSFALAPTVQAELAPVQIDEPIPAMTETPVLSISNGFVVATDLGDGLYESEIRAQGTLTNSNGSINTGFALDCEVDTGAHTLQCLGVLRVGTVDAPIGLQFANGTARYALHVDAPTSHRVAWELWHGELTLADIIPPILGGVPGETNDDLADADGGGGGGHFPGIDIDGPWIIVDYGSDITVILDGAVVQGGVFS